MSLQIKLYEGHSQPWCDADPQHAFAPSCERKWKLSWSRRSRMPNLRHLNHQLPVTTRMLKKATSNFAPNGYWEVHRRWVQNTLWYHSLISPSQRMTTYFSQIIPRKWEGKSCLETTSDVESYAEPMSPSPPPSNQDDDDGDSTSSTQTQASTSGYVKRYNFSPDQEWALAEWYQEHPQFYNKENPNYKDAERKKNIIERKAANMRPPCTCKYIYFNIQCMCVCKTNNYCSINMMLAWPGSEREASDDFPCFLTTNDRKMEALYKTEDWIYKDFSLENVSLELQRNEHVCIAKAFSWHANDFIKDASYKIPSHIHDIKHE